MIDDTTRVLLQGNEDYINASYVNQVEEFKTQFPVHLVAATESNTRPISCQMEIPAAKLVNRYIAAQGPLPHTCAQFWQVVWDQKLSLIVMLTTLTERGRQPIQRSFPQ
ncbi:Tyrosine-protein phosphatase non-receptor type 3 [Saguinus oedipus]|uniref:Tyrosine-protein phosphatase non-receptor type 3 n=1 Tax=Saguinus oedipus TaxID=9490 RepID=A0ABQ9WER8_SAGOE|nr:Tyrosine-protein phosphatase non-receptor type 3 [Saguinus oedipus]